MYIKATHLLNFRVAKISTQRFNSTKMLMVKEKTTKVTFIESVGSEFKDRNREI